jgi:hypothetical protein
VILVILDVSESDAIGGGINISIVAYIMQPTPNTIPHNAVFLRSFLFACLSLLIMVDINSL